MNSYILVYKALVLVQKTMFEIASLSSGKLINKKAMYPALIRNWRRRIFEVRRWVTTSTIPTGMELPFSIDLERLCTWVVAASQ